ncbi:hypothetical protein GOODEAATRI_016020, partial [Goodea atripinnis]
AGGWGDLSSFVAVVEHLQRGGVSSGEAEEELQVCQSGSGYRAKSTGRLDKASGLQDSVDPPVKLHLSIHASHCPLLCCDDRHLHLPVIDQREACDWRRGRVTLLIPSSQMYFHTSWEVANELFLWTIGLCFPSLAASALKHNTEGHMTRCQRLEPLRGESEDEQGVYL